MRVIRTELYFAESDILGRNDKSSAVPGIAAAWFRASSENPTDPIELSKRIFHPKLPYATLDAADAGGVFKSFADLCVRDVATPHTVQDILSGKWQVENTKLAESLLDYKIVIENNIDLITIKDALKNAKYISIGFLVGYQALSTPVILVSVPAGIFLIGITITMTQVVQKMITEHFEKK
jgi:hypothetical protein